MPRAYIALGSNISPAQNVRAALHCLAGKARLSGLSMVYVTTPLGRPEQPPYYNCVAEIETAWQPLEIKHGVLLPIENSLGRKRTADKYAARTIDLDLLLYGDLVMDADGIRLPDPDITERPFLAIPLFELTPNMVLPGSKRPIAEVAASLPRGGMAPLEEYACLLRKELGIDR